MDFHFLIWNVTVSYTDLHSKYPAGLDSKPELRDLMNEVAAAIPSKWKDVGLQLGLDDGVLEGIGGDNSHCYMDVFTRWKNQKSTTHPYTWSTLVQALKTPAVGEERLADKIKIEGSGRYVSVICTDVIICVATCSKLKAYY